MTLALIAPLPGLAGQARAEGEESDAGASAITGGSMDWGVRESYRKYVVGSASGRVTLSEGVTENADGTYRWPVAEGTFDSATGALDVRFEGKANFWGHEGLMDLTIWDLRIVADAYGSAVLRADYRVDDGTTVRTGDDVEFAEISAALGGTVTPDEGSLVWEDVYASLGRGGVEPFLDHYSYGNPVDPISLDLTGGWPSGTVPETWAEQGTLAAAVEDIALPASAGTGWTANGVVVDRTRGVVFVPGEGGALHVYDIKTREVISVIDGAAFPLDLNETTGELLVKGPNPGTDYWLVEPDGEGGYRLGRGISGLYALTTGAIDESSGAIVIGAGTRKYVYLPGDDGEYALSSEYLVRASGIPRFFDSETGILYAQQGQAFHRFRITDGVLEPIDQVTLAGTSVSAYVPDLDHDRIFATVDGELGVYSGVREASGTLSPVSSVSAADGLAGAVVRYDPDEQRLLTTGGATAQLYDLEGSEITKTPVLNTSWDSSGAGSFRGYEFTASDSAWFVYSTLIKVVTYGTTPTISELPDSATVRVPEGSASAAVELSADVTGHDVSVQWQRKIPGDISFRDIEGETSLALSSDVNGADDGTQYRLVASNDFGRVVSSAVTLQVEQLTSPAIVTQPGDVTVAAGNRASFTLAATGTPAPEIAWQRRVNGFWQNVATDDDNIAVDGSALVIRDTNVDQSGSVFRAKVANSVGAVYSRSVKLTVNPAVSIPEDGLTLDGVKLEWSGSQELQKRAPNGQANPFVAGVSDGTEATYKASEGDVSVVHRAADGAESTPTWATRDAQTGGEVTQLVRLGGGEAQIAADGSATVAWDGSWSVNFYGPLVPFTFTDPELVVDKDGKGTLTADLSGYASSQDDPDVKEPLEPVEDVTVATFSDVSIDPAGTVTVAPDYAGVEVSTGDAIAQDRTVDGWGAWPQPFVDFHLDTGLSSYWYSSGGAADPYKKPAAFVVDFTDAEQTDGPSITAPQITSQPGSVSVVVGGEVELSVAATGDELSYRWQKRVGSLWIDIPDETTASLKLSKVEAEDAGRYRVRVSNTAGTAVSDAAVVTIAKHATTLTVAAPSATFGRRATVTVTVPGRTGQVTLTGAGSARTATLTGGKATFTLPKRLAAKKYTLKVSYAGDATNASASASKKLTVKRAGVSFRQVKVTKKPTSTKAGRLVVRLRSATGATVTGKVRVTVTKGNTTRRVTATVRRGKATIRLPKSSTGTWKVKAAYNKTTNFKAKTKTTKVNVTR